MKLRNWILFLTIISIAKKCKIFLFFFYFFCLRSVDNVCQITFNFSLSKYYWSSPTLLHHHRHRYLFMSYHYDCYMIVLVCMCVVIKFWKHMIEIQLNQNSRLNHNMADSSGTNIESNWFIIICTSTVTISSKCGQKISSYVEQ